MRSKYLLGILGLVMLLLVLVGPAIAADENEDLLVDNPPGTEIPVDVLSSPVYGEARVENEFRGENGWSNEIFVLVIQEPQKWISIHLYDRFWYGDYYELWEISPHMQFIGMTPRVETDWHHGSATYPCPVGEPLHTGTGAVHSDDTFTVVKEIGVYKYRVRDPLLQELIDEGLDPHVPPWTPAGFYIDFTETAPAPELPTAVPLIVSLIVIALVPLKRKLWKK